MKRIVLLLFVVFFLPFYISFAEDTTANVKEFVANNPDGGKYQFTKDYLMALSYLQGSSKKFANRQNELADVILNDKNISAQVEFLVKDNINWRVAKNLVDKYRVPENGLILKASDLFVRFCNEQIEYNNQERAIWNKYLRGKNSEVVLQINSENFATPLRNLESMRRAAWQKLLEASSLVSKVLISSQLDYLGELTNLGISKEERINLMHRVDAFEGEGFKGPVRDGQTFLEASVSVIRGTLENPSLNPFK